MTYSSMMRVVQVALVLSLCHGAASAQSWEVFDMSTAGLPSNSITDIAEDSQGIIWVGTNWGLARYDGTTWTVYQAGTSGLPSNVIRSVAVDSVDRVWVGTQQSGVVIFDGQDWSGYDMDNSPLPGNEINCITIDHRGWAWIGGYLGVACYTGADWRLYNTSDTSYAGLQLHGNTIEDVAVRSDGLVAIGTQNGGFHYLTDTSIQFLTTYDDQFPDNTQNAVIFDEVNNERWLATPAQGLLRQGGDWTNGPWFQYNSNNSTIPSNALNCLDEDDAGNIWFGTLLAGVGVRRTNGSFTNYLTTNSDLPNNTVDAIRIAHDGSVWIGTGYGGLAHLTFPEAVANNEPRTFQAYPIPCSVRLSIRGNGIAPGSVWELYDAQGRRTGWGQLAGDQSEIDVSSVRDGMYTLLIIEGGVSVALHIPVVR